MKASEPLVQRHRLVTVVDSEIAVVQVVEIVVSHEAPFLFRHQLVESRMPERRAHCCMHEVVYRMNWMRGNDPVKQDTREIEQMLDRVHGQPRPRTNVDVLVVQVM